VFFTCLPSFFCFCRKFCIQQLG